MEALVINSEKIADINHKFLFNASTKDKNKKGIFEKVLIKKELIFSTDGYRLHAVPNKLELQNGVYSVERKTTRIVLLKSNDEYPEITKITDIKKSKALNKFIAGDESTNCKNLFLIYKDVQKPFNFNYFNSAMEYGCEYEPHLCDSVLFLENCNGNKAWIMSIEMF